MMKKIKIHNPCPENWDSMTDSPEGKFCEKCSRCVVDFTNKTDTEITDIFAEAKGNKICGKIQGKAFSSVAAGIVLFTNLTFTKAQIYKSDTSTEKTINEITKISGRLISNENQKIISNAEVFFITKNKFIKTTTNHNGYFSLEITDNDLNYKNLLYFCFDNLTNSRYENQTIIFLRNEKVENIKVLINNSQTLIGEVVFVEGMDTPPDYYYFNGNYITEEHFEKIKKDNPLYQYFYFEGKDAEVIDENSFINTLHLLFSK